MIPELLHFIWIDLGKNKLPSDYLQNIRLAQKTTNLKIFLHTNLAGLELPGVTVVPHTPTENLKILSEPVGQGVRVSHYNDILRLDILHKYGGIYSDLDVIWLRHPWHLLHHKAFIGFDNAAYKILCNAIIGAEQGHPGLLEYKKWLLDIWPCKKYWVPANPWKIWKDRTDITFLKKKVFFPFNWRTDLSKIEMENVLESVAIHLYASSGHDFGGPLFEHIKNYLSS